LIVFLFFVMGLVAPLVAPYSPEAIDLGNAFQKPSLDHWAGTDNLGRDILSRILYGTRISITTGVLAVVIALALGIPIGLVAGHWSGRTDMVLMRLMDILLSFPGILLAIAIIVVLGPGLGNAILAVGIASVPLFARLVRGQCLQIRELEFVEAARAIGESHVSIMIRYLFPNSLPAVVVQATLRVATAVIVASGLSFLGLGAQPPTPEWGAMLSEGREFIRSAPFLTIFPGLALMLFVLGFNLFADGLIDVLNPRVRNER
jgi:peptide/nickel transport system permease protein